MKTLQAPVQTVPVARSRLGGRRAAGIAALLLVLSVLRPWGGPPASGERRAETLTPAATADASPPPAPTAKPTPGPDEIACPPVGWQLVSLDRLGPWTVRTWTPASPALASGPLDPSIDEISLDSPAVLALGGCAPSTAAPDQALEGMRTRVVAVWQRDAGRLRPVAVETLGPTQADPAIALLYRPVSQAVAPAAGSAVGSPRAWPPGHFVVELALLDEPGPAPGDAYASGASAPPGWFIALSVPGPS